MTGTPALVLNGRLDILAANALGYALYSPVYADPVRPANNARFLFLDPHATESFPIPADPSQSLLTYTTEPGSPSHDALSLLASWATSPAHDSDASTHHNDQQAPQQDQGYDSRSGFVSRPNET